jgi:hypothetical protein
MVFSMAESKNVKRERAGYSAHEQLSGGRGSRYSLVHLERSPCPNPAHRGLRVGNEYVLGHEEIVWRVFSPSSAVHRPYV